MVKSNNKSTTKRLAEHIALQYNDKVTPLDKIVADEELNVFYDNYESNTFDGMTIFDNGSFYVHLILTKGIGLIL